MRLPLFALLCCLALPAAAQIYTYTDANGNKVFTSQPPDGVSAEAVELQQINSIEMQVPATPPSMPGNDSATRQPAYSRLALRLEENQSIRANSGDFAVLVDLQPELRPEHRLVLLVDGQRQGAPSGTPRLIASGLERGAHQLAVEVIGNRGVVQRSATLTVNVQRISVNSPARAPANGSTPPTPTPPTPPSPPSTPSKPAPGRIQ